MLDVAEEETLKGLQPEAVAAKFEAVSTFDPNTGHTNLNSLPTLRNTTLQLNSLRGYEASSEITYLWNQMHLMEEHQAEHGEWSNSLVVGSSVVAASGFTIGVALWTLRTGYLVMLVSSALPNWAGFDPIPVLDHDALSARDLFNTKRQKTLAEIASTSQGAAVNAD